MRYPQNKWLPLLTTLTLLVACGGNNDDNNDPMTMEDDMSQTSPVEDMTAVEEDMGTDTPDEGGDTPDMRVEEDMALEPDMNVEPDMTVTPGADVPEVEPNDTVDPDTGEDEATPFDVGQSVGGNIAASAAGEFGDIDYFKVELTAGTLFEWSVQAGDGISEAGLATILTDNISLQRVLYDTDGDTRQAFIPEDGTYYLLVYDAADEQLEEADIPAHGGPSATYTVTTSEKTLTTQALSAPGSVEGDLNDGLVDAYAFTWGSDSVIDAQIFGEREPTLSDIDSVLFLWDATNNTVITSNDDLSDESYDSALLAAGVSGAEYYLIVDSFLFAPVSEYQLVVKESDDAVNAPGLLTVGTPSTGTIGDANAAAETFDSDFWTFTAQPGDTITVSVTAEDALQPALTLYLMDSGGFEELSFARPVDDTAAATLVVPDDIGGPIELLALVDDIRNYPVDETDTSDYVGGVGFGYTINAAIVTPTINMVALPLSETGTLAMPGDFAWYEIPTVADSVLLFSAQSTFADQDDNAQLLGTWLAPMNTLRFVDENGLFLNSSAGNKTFGLVDAFFLASTLAAPYDYTFGIQSVELGSVPFAEVTEPTDNTTQAAAAAPALPFSVKAQTQSMDPATPSFDYYNVTLTAGQTVIALTSENPDAPVDAMGNVESADTVLRVLDASGTEVAVNDDVPGEALQNTFSGLSFTAPADGTYTIVIEPYYSDFAGDYDNGYYTLRVLLAP